MNLYRYWEGICSKCGSCCYEKEYRNKLLVVHNNRPCEHLDEDAGSCRVYSRRFLQMKSCRKMTLFHALFSAWLPDHCAYVRWAKRNFIRIPLRLPFL